MRTSVIARGTPGTSGADLANLVSKPLFAARFNKRLVGMNEFSGAGEDKIAMGAGERESMVMTESERDDSLP